MSDLEPLLPSLAAMLKKRGVTKQMAYDKYKLQYPDGYQHSAFLVRINRFMNIGKPSMKMSHKAGDKLFVDFTGQKLEIVEKLTGEVREVEVFVAILGCSQLTFCNGCGNAKEGGFYIGLRKSASFLWRCTTSNSS